MVYAEDTPAWPALKEPIFIQTRANVFLNPFTGPDAAFGPEMNGGCVPAIRLINAGGGVLGQIVTLALPSVVAAAATGHLSVGGIVSQVIAGGAGGAILTAIIGAIKNKAMA